MSFKETRQLYVIARQEKPGNYAVLIMQAVPLEAEGDAQQLFCGFKRVTFGYISYFNIFLVLHIIYESSEYNKPCHKSLPDDLLPNPTAEIGLYYLVQPTYTADVG